LHPAILGLLDRLLDRCSDSRSGERRLDAFDWGNARDFGPSDSTGGYILEVSTVKVYWTKLTLTFRRLLESGVLCSGPVSALEDLDVSTDILAC
jgi:hypothetical protein